VQCKRLVPAMLSFPMPADTTHELCLAVLTASLLSCHSNMTAVQGRLILGHGTLAAHESGRWPGLAFFAPCCELAASVCRLKQQFIGCLGVLLLEDPRAAHVILGCASLGPVCWGF
jgi:hypothetical protein